MLSLLKKIILFPVDLVYMTIDLLVICVRFLIWRIGKRTSTQPCRFLQGELLDEQPAIVRSAMKYNNLWLVRLIAPHIRTRKHDGKIVPVTNEEDANARYPLYDFVLLAAVVVLWVSSFQAVLQLATPYDPSGGGKTQANWLSFFFPDQGKTEDLRDEGDRKTTYNPTRAEKYYNRAMISLDKGQYDEALVNLRIAKQANEFDPKILFQLGRLYQGIGRFLDSEAAFRAAIERDENHTESLLAMAEIYRRKNNLVEARTFAERALASDANNVDALQTNAILLAMDGKIDEARPLAEKVIELDPDNVRRLVAMGRLYGVFAREPERSHELLDRALAANPKHPEAWAEKIRLFYRTNELEKGDDALAHLLKISPNDVEANRLDAEMMLQRYGLNVGLSQYESLMKRFADEEGIRLRYAELLLLTGNTSEGITRCKELAKSRIPSIERSASWLLANAYFQAGMHEDAIRYTDDVLKASPYARAPLLLKARAQLLLGYEGEARTNMRRILTNNPLDQEVVVLLADSLKKSDRPDEAMKLVDEHLESNPNHDLVRLARTGLLMHFDRWDEALTEVDALYEKYPGHPILTNNLAFQLARADKDLDRAYELIAPMYEAQGGNPSVADTYAYVLARQGKHKDALPAFERALRTQGGAGSAGIRFRYARSLFALERYAEARREAEICLKIDPEFDEAADVRVFVKAARDAEASSAAGGGDA